MVRKSNIAQRFPNFMGICIYKSRDIVSCAQQLFRNLPSCLSGIPNNARRDFANGPLHISNQPISAQAFYTYPMLHVHYQNAGEEELAELIRPLLDPQIRFTIGAAHPDRLACHVLVAGGLDDPETFDSRAELTHVVLPWVGVSTHTQSLVKARPHLSLHNLHHNAAATAETAMTLLLCAAQKTLQWDSALRQGTWRDLTTVAENTLSLAGRNALILGYGAIGKRVAQQCQAFGMNVSAIRRSVTQPVKDVNGVTQHPVSAFHNLLPNTQALICILPATNETKNFITAEAFELLPKNAVFVNVGRGSNVDQEVLYNALKNGDISAAGIDVWYNYPKGVDRSRYDVVDVHPAEYPFWELDNVVLSPHRGGMGDQTEPARAVELAKVLNAIVRGEDVPNKIDFERQY